MATSTAQPYFSQGIQAEEAKGTSWFKPRDMTRKHRATARVRFSCDQAAKIARAT